MSERGTTTTLWTLIDALQRRLEAEGFGRELVDVAVTRGVEAWLDLAPPVRAERRERRAALRPLSSKA
jgi:hypothetical protein